jgi:hypothetical protein
MNEIIDTADVIAVVKSFCGVNKNDESTIELIMAIGAELLDVSVDTINEMMEGY